MKDRIYLLLRCTVETPQQKIHDAIAEFQEQTNVQVTSTPTVKVLQVDIVKLNAKNPKS